jgi:flagellar biosynthesis protein FliR
MAIQIGGDIIGNFMGFSAASQFDANQQSQSQVVERLLYTLMVLVFLAVNGHHLMLMAVMKSYEVVGIGQASISGNFAQRLVEFSSSMIRLGMQLAAPMAFSIFVINLIYGVFAKALPQMNILILSLSVSAFVGLFVLLVSLPQFQSTSTELFSRIGHEMGTTLLTLKGS